MKAKKVTVYSAIAENPGIDTDGLLAKTGANQADLYKAVDNLIITGLIIRQHLGGARYGYFVAPK